MKKNYFRKWERIKFNIWDTVSKERFRPRDLKIVRGAIGIILAFDFTKRSSFQNLETWIRGN